MTKVYFADVSPLSSKELYESFLEKMPEYRREKIRRLKFDGDRMLSLGAGILLERALDDAGYDGERNVSLGDHGKPRLSGGVCFSLSHSKNIAMCAISEREIGCDVEYVGNPNYSVAAKFFSEAEREYICSYKREANKANAFYKIWTLKESFLKAIGTGFTVSPSSFSAVRGKRIALCQNIVPGEWTLYEVKSPGGCRAAVCTAGETGPVETEIIKL